MKLAVLDVDIEDLPSRLTIGDGYDGAVVLLRVDGRPSGQAILKGPLDLDAAALEAHLLGSADSAFWEAWLHHKLGLPPEGPCLVSLPSATVVICTRDRTEDLAACLTKLAAMTYQAPVLVIDNAPSDDSTRDLIARHPTVRYLREPRAGLNNARNKALAECRSDILVFIDDDAVPDQAWLPTLLRNFEDSTIGAATGLTMALELENDAQIVFQRVGGFSRGFKRAVYDSASLDPFLAWQAGAGVNMAIRRSVVDAVGTFDPALDAGTRTLAGGDTDFFRRIITHGYSIAYDPQALNWHRHRRSLAELERQIYGYEAAAFAVYTKALLFERDTRAAGKIVHWIGRKVPELVRHWRRPPTLPINITSAQVRGAMSGPGRYLRSRRQAARE